jgi:hypothetical protein
MKTPESTENVSETAPEDANTAFYGHLVCIPEALFSPVSNPFRALIATHARSVRPARSSTKQAFVSKSWFPFAWFLWAILGRFS